MRNITIYFDGGTTCNIPKLGYGNGYGSFKLTEGYNNGQIQRVDHGLNHSNNSAEVLTLVSALIYLYEQWDLNITDWDNVNILIIGDSQIALNQASKCFKDKMGFIFHKRSSRMYKDALKKLHYAILPFKSIDTKWIPRKEIFEIFGH